MSFFQTFVFSFAGFILLGAVFDRLLPKKTLSTKIYGLIGLCIIALIFWTIIQMIFGFPQIDNYFPVTAVVLGILFSVGIKAAYGTLKERDSIKKQKRARSKRNI
jgi:uncharacterized membrane protein